MWFALCGTAPGPVHAGIRLFSGAHLDMCCLVAGCFSFHWLQRRRPCASTLALEKSRERGLVYASSGHGIDCWGWIVDYSCSHFGICRGPASLLHVVQQHRVKPFDKQPVDLPAALCTWLCMPPARSKLRLATNLQPVQKVFCRQGPGSDVQYHFVFYSCSPNTTTGTEQNLQGRLVICWLTCTSVQMTLRPDEICESAPCTYKNWYQCVWRVCSTIRTWILFSSQDL